MVNHYIQYQQTQQPPLTSNDLSPQITSHLKPPLTSNHLSPQIISHLKSSLTSNHLSPQITKQNKNESSYENLQTTENSPC